MAVAATAGLASVLVAHSSSGGTHVVGGPQSATHSTKGGSSSKTKSKSKNSSKTGAKAPSGTHSAVGTLYSYGYGEVSVKVTVSGSKITGAAVAKLRTADQYSQSIAQQAIPILRNEVMKAQTARIQSLSGATYTSEAYAASIQSALDKLGVKR